MERVLLFEKFRHEIGRYACITVSLILLIESIMGFLFIKFDLLHEIKEKNRNKLKRYNQKEL